MRSNYSYEIEKTDNSTILSIIDQGGNYMSVTNNIENVIAEICKSNNIDILHTKVVYRDSEGIWDAWDTENEAFVMLNANSREEAIKKYLHES